MVAHINTPPYNRKPRSRLHLAVGMTRSAAEVAAAVTFALVLASGCGSSAGNPGTQSGANGGSAAIGAAGSGGFAGARPMATGGATAAGGLTGISVGSGGTPDAGMGAAGVGDDAGGKGGAASTGGTSAGGHVGTGSGGQAGGSSMGGQAGAAVGMGILDELYEAESIPPNQVFGYARATKCTPACAKPLTVGSDCCSGSGQVTWIVSANSSHAAGWMQFAEVSAPADASYDVTVWYHCGDADTYGDNNCGGQAMTEPKQTGCRPHVFTVNGTVVPGAYHFPCFGGSWATLYAATVSLPLTAGSNTIKIAPPPPRDAVDVDAIEILPPGKGHAPRIAANTTDLVGK